MTNNVCFFCAGPPSSALKRAFCSLSIHLGWYIRTQESPLQTSMVEKIIDHEASSDTENTHIRLRSFLSKRSFLDSLYLYLQSCGNLSKHLHASISRARSLIPRLNCFKWRLRSTRTKVICLLLLHFTATSTSNN